jgi:hypothetical protein
MFKNKNVEFEFIDSLCQVLPDTKEGHIHIIWSDGHIEVNRAIDSIHDSVNGESIKYALRVSKNPEGRGNSWDFHPMF